MMVQLWVSCPYSDTWQTVSFQLDTVRYLHVIQCCLSSNKDADNIGPAAVPVSPPPPLPPPLSPMHLPPSPPALACSSMQRAIKTQGGLVLCAEQSGCQRPRGPCPWAQQQPRSAVLLFAGAPRHHARASLRSALSQGALWICDRLWVGEFILMLKRQRTQTDNPRLKQSCSNFPPLNKGTYVQTVKFNSITYAVCSACFSAKDFPTVNRKLQLQPENA